LVTVAGLAALGIGATLVHAVGSRLYEDDPVLRWNAIGTQACGTLERGTTEQRDIAMMQLAVHDALNAIRPRYASYALHMRPQPQASAPAAIATAAHDVLVATIPGERANLDADYAEDLAAIPKGTAKRDGIAIGRASAQAILLMRARDGADAADIDDTPSPGMGRWEATPPEHRRALMPGWTSVTPFAMQSAAQFAPPPPPALHSAQYARDYEEVRRLGGEHSDARTEEQTQIARYWSSNAGAFWNEIARLVVNARQHDGNAGNNLDTWQRARMFAMLNTAMADGFVSAWEAKYRYRYWRPITAIHRGEADGNPATRQDAGWTSLLVTPEHPEYPSAHSVLSGAASAVLRCALGDDRTPFRLTSHGAFAGITRHYPGFEAAAKEIADSRVYAGAHFRTANTEGLAEGRRIGTFVCRDLLPPLPG
jgi:hypothetical protein